MNLNRVVSTNSKQCSGVHVFIGREVCTEDRSCQERSTDAASAEELRLTSKCEGERRVVAAVSRLPDHGNLESRISDLWQHVKVKTTESQVTCLQGLLEQATD